MCSMTLIEVLDVEKQGLYGPPLEFSANFMLTAVFLPSMSPGNLANP